MPTEITPRPTSIRIFLANGIPDGIRIVEKSNWIGRAVVASRTHLPAALVREEMSRPGIYLLLGAGDGGSARLYIGEADVLRDRLKQHASQKDFWTRFVAFTSTNEGLNKAFVRYLEARLVAMARSANQWELDNGSSPSEPPLSEPDKADAEWFLAEMLLIYPLLGVDAFESASEERSVSSEEEILRLTDRGGDGRGREVADGFVVLQGSKAKANEVPSIPGYLSEFRQQLRNRGVLRDDGGTLEFTQDFRFLSPSMAAGVLVGGTANGRRMWKNAAGVELKQLQDARAIVPD